MPGGDSLEIEEPLREQPFTSPCHLAEPKARRGRALKVGGTAAVGLFVIVAAVVFALQRCGSQQERRPRRKSTCRTCVCSGGRECPVATVPQGGAGRIAVGDCELEHAEDPRLPPTKRCATYTQRWELVEGGAGKPEDKYPAELNARLTALAVPTGPMPADGWPFILYFMFMDRHGKLELWEVNGPGGLVETRFPDSDECHSEEQDMLYAFVASGHAVLMTSMWTTGGLFFNADRPGRKCDHRDPAEFCWNDGANPDMLYLRELFTGLRERSLWKDTRLDYGRMVLLGYSVGTHMASQCMNSFARQEQLHGEPMPTIKASIFIAGGSMRCYNYEGKLDNTDKPPDNYLPCISLTKGCCPRDATEDNYDRGAFPWDQHPPVLLLQTEADRNADPDASRLYFGVISANSKAPVCMLYASGDAHGPVACQIPAAVGFAQEHI